MEIRNTWSKEGINIHFESFLILWLTCTDAQTQFIAGLSFTGLT